MFDANWYRLTYNVQDPRRFYARAARTLRHSPNRLFDEGWYLARYRDAAEAVTAGRFTSGFDHYRQVGLSSNSPNSLFDEAYYRMQYPALFLPGGVVDVVGYANGYDHYLECGAFEGRTASLFFDPLVWLAHRDGAAEQEGGLMQFEACLSDHERARLQGMAYPRCSWYFDPVWYQATYPTVMEEVKAGLWSSPLAHYLGNPTPLAFDPLPVFSEDFYGNEYPDVTAGVRSGAFRNHYEHFLRCGAAEGRQPSKGAKLARIEDDHGQFAILGDDYPTPFARFAAQGTPTARLRPPSEAQAKLLFLRHAAVDAALLKRRGLTLAPAPGQPIDMSVVIVAHNKSNLTLSCLSSLSRQGLNLDIIVVDSGSTDDTRHLESTVTGLRTIRFDSNVGYIAGSNAGLAAARADAVLFLNNDVVLAQGALVAALSRLRSDVTIAAVGARILRSHGVLQEAGCIIWRDGRTTGYMRDRAHDAPEANFVRRVDFCSGAFLLADTAVVRRLGGFDPAYSPCYYEDADLCVRLRQEGYSVVYDPTVVVHHLEYGSSDADISSELIRLARGIFCQRHTEFLRRQYNFKEREYVRARTTDRSRPVVLYLEDCLPLRRLGSGYVRSNDIVSAMSRLGYAVTVFPLRREEMAGQDIHRDFPDDVELMHDRSEATFGTFLAERSQEFDLLWIGRTHNLTRLMPLLCDLREHLPDFGIILDTEAVTAPREIMRQRLLTGTGPEIALEDLLAEELRYVGYSQAVVAVNEQDAALIRQKGHQSVGVLGHVAVPKRAARGFLERHGLLFVGALHSSDSPNYDSLVWLLSDILPLIDQAYGSEIEVTVAGEVRPGVDKHRFACSRRIRYLGGVPELDALYDHNRVFLAPTRFAGGIPFKVHAAAAAGIPVVATSILCQQLGWQDGCQVVDGGDNDPAAFAQAVIGLYRDENAWSAIQQAAFDTIERENSQAGFDAALLSITKGVLDCQ